AFYGTCLGLPELPEPTLLRGVVPAGSSGVVEFDAGGVIVMTHTPAGAAAAAGRGSSVGRGLGPGLHTPRMAASLGGLTRKGVAVPPKVGEGRVGRIAGLTGPSGHPLYLYEPSEEALRQPSGLLIQRILETLAEPELAQGYTHPSRPEGDPSGPSPEAPVA